MFLRRLLNMTLHEVSRKSHLYLKSRKRKKQQLDISLESCSSLFSRSVAARALSTNKESFKKLWFQKIWQWEYVLLFAIKPTGLKCIITLTTNIGKGMDRGLHLQFSIHPLFYQPFFTNSGQKSKVGEIIFSFSVG